jgi:putative ABC transport system permease protein
VFLSLGVAIGANTANFTLLDAVILRPLAVPGPSRIANVTLLDPDGSQRTFSYTQLNELRAR